MNQHGITPLAHVRQSTKNLIHSEQGAEV